LCYHKFKLSHKVIKLQKKAYLIQVSILLAARNEAANILACLQSLHKQDYDSQSFEVLIGNDFSEDETAQIARNFIADKPNFKLFDIDCQLNNLKGKANVLAQLGKQAQGQWLFFTDADMVLPETWVKEMIKVLAVSQNRNKGTKVGIVTGFTTVDWWTEKAIFLRIFAALQACDWTFYLGCVHFLAACKISTTAMGNNMAVNKMAYLQIGGYENLAFSITEDYALYKKIISQGFDFQQLANEKVLGITKPAKSLVQLLGQRRRWVAEFRNFDWWAVAAILWQGLQFPILLATFFWSLPVFSMLLGFNFLFVLAILLFYLCKTKQIDLLFFAFFYFIFNLLFSFFLLCYLPLNKKIKWKGRVYYTVNG
jgi:1,2-diacylglycerol 3-beta-glucosyltransferase